MAANITEIRAKVSARIKDTAARLTTSPDMTCDVDRAILDALALYEKVRPLSKTLKLDGDGGFDYAVSSLTGFVDGFSVVVDVVYPYLATDQILSVLEREEWGLVRLDTGLKLRFFLARPAATEDFLALFTTPHTLNAATSTVASSDDEALADLGAAFAHDQLASLYAQDTDSTITADAVDRRAKSENHRAQAASYRKSYAEKMQIGTSQQAAFAVAEMDRAFSNEVASDYFFHGRRRF
jgi:hypothetical protein